MSNEAFTVAVQQRLLLPIGKTWKYCQCDKEIGPFFSHCYRCPVLQVRNPIRNSLHKEMKERFSDILKARINISNQNCRVLEGEPRLENYFERLVPPPDPPDPGPNYFQSTQFDRRGFEGVVKVRADMGVQLTDLNKNLVIDFTFVEPTARTFIGTYNKAGQAAIMGRDNKKKNEYKHWKVDGDYVTNKFKVVAVETFGIVLKEDIVSIFGQFINEKEDRGGVLNLVTQQLSVAVHTMRAMQFKNMQDKQALRDRPYRPLRNIGARDGVIIE
jgi:hypothetical protein